MSDQLIYNTFYENKNANHYLVFDQADVLKNLAVTLGEEGTRQLIEMTKETSEDIHAVFRHNQFVVYFRYRINPGIHPASPLSMQASEFNGVGSTSEDYAEMNNDCGTIPVHKFMAVHKDIMENPGKKSEIIKAYRIPPPPSCF